jgi:hypothetical protein
MTWFDNNVNDHPVVTPLEIDLGIIAHKELAAEQNSVSKVEYPNEYAHQDEYAVYGWIKWDADVVQYPLHLIARLTINEPEYQGDASLLGDRTLGLWVNDDGNFYFSTYTYEFNVGQDNMDRYTKIDYEDSLTDWVWIYYGYDPEVDQAIAYCRFRDREVIEF